MSARRAEDERRRGGRASRSPATSGPPSCSRPTATGSTSSTTAWAPSCGRRTSLPHRLPTPRSVSVPLAVKDLFCTEGVPTTAGSRILEGHRPLYTATAVRRLAAAGAPMLGKTNMDEFAMGSSNENSGYGDRAQPVGPGACSGRLQRGVRGRGGGRPRAVGDRHGHRRVDPSAGVAVRHRGTEADLRGDLPLRHGRVRVLAGPVRPADAHGHRRGAAVASPRRPRPLRLDLARSARGGAAAESHGPEGTAVRGAARARLRRRGGRGRRRRGLRPHPRPHHRARRGGGAGRVAPCTARDLRLLRDRARPRPRRTWPATTASATGRERATGRCSTCTSARARRASATR